MNPYPQCISDIADVQIQEDTGKAKYVLIKVSDPSGRCKVIVRSDKCAEYHADIYEPFAERLRPLGWKTECLGGGRIFRDVEFKSICVYGYSIGFGKADHDLTVEILKKNLTDQKDIRWSDEGY